MKLSKLLLITIVGLLLTILDVTIDTHNRDSVISAEQLTTAAKSCLHSISHNGAIVYAKMKDDIRKVTYEEYVNNGENLAFNLQDQMLEYDY